MSRRGLSDVVTTVLIILVVVVSVVAIGAYVTNLVRSSGRTVEREGACLANTIKVDGCRQFISQLAVENNRTVVSSSSTTDALVDRVIQLSYFFTYKDGSSELFTSSSSLPPPGKASISQEFTRMNKAPSSVQVGGSYVLKDGKTITCAGVKPVSCVTEATNNPSYLSVSAQALNVGGSIGGAGATPVAGAGSTGTVSSVLARVVGR
ncbi:hypothetical protein EXS73_02235 [Candidatus Pacearchaeota archaeon]|nr:hypothetical protein [Candidatus Pacearchaeota archaeon]